MLLATGATASLPFFIFHAAEKKRMRYVERVTRPDPGEEAKARSTFLIKGDFQQRDFRIEPVTAVGLDPISAREEITRQIARGKLKFHFHARSRILQLIEIYTRASQEAQRHRARRVFCSHVWTSRICNTHGSRAHV